MQEELEKRISNILKSMLDDPLLILLLKKSNLTLRQFSVLLVDFLSEELSGGDLTQKEKAKILPKPLSRGAYSRILSQARRNIIASLCTIFLIGYTGLLDLPSLSELIHFGNQMREFIRQYRGGEITPTEARKIVAKLMEILERSMS